MKLLKLIVITLGIIIAPVFVVSNVNAISGPEFQAGKIIDDGMFFNGNGLDAGQVQAFLNAKVPVCDTSHIKSNNVRDSGPPYTCLKDFRQDAPAIAADAYCNGISPGNKSAAQIIYEVGVSCGVSQKTILVTLQKEQSFVTDTWPRNIEYERAMGYACPDTPLPAATDTNGNNCDDSFEGFFKQVYYGTRQFKRYVKDANIFTTYRPYKTWNIRYHPSNSSCGSPSVYIQNNATAALYIYTPYQPNAAALSVVTDDSPGPEVDCGAYGNRNFWWTFRKWFGSVSSNCTFPNGTANGIYRLYNQGTGNQLLTTDPNEVCAATSIGWMYDGQIFKENTPGGQPIYRLERGGRYLYTNSIIERDEAISGHGFRYEGVAFNGVDPNATPAIARAVYRLASVNGTYVYTISDYEKLMYQSYGYRYEGIAFYLVENPGNSIASTYRLSHPTGTYLYTTSTTERDSAMQGFGYNYEGIGFNAITQMNKITIPIYRLAGAKGYILTNSLYERVAARQLGYRDEGIAFYTYGVIDDPALKKLYRLVNTGGVYLYTASELEKTDAQQRYGYRLEGIGFLTP